MKKHFILFCSHLILLFAACNTDPAPSGIVAGLPSVTDTVIRKNIMPTVAKAMVPTSHDCIVRGKRMEDNELWIPAEQLLFCIVADRTTNDPDFGDSYRILTIYDTKDCSLLERKVLPVNNSPDFPWYIFQNTYEEKNQVVCTSGFEFTFCYDVENRELFPRMKPDYLLKRTALDAQSGMTQSMAVYDHYVFGHAQDLGFFAYDLTDKKAVKNLLPVAEYHFKKVNKFHPLFLIPTEDEKYQIIIPRMNPDDGKITLAPLLKKPININSSVAKNIWNNRFQIFTDLDSATEEKVAFDLQKRSLVALPTAITTAPVDKVLAYLKSVKK